MKPMRNDAIFTMLAVFILLMPVPALAAQAVQPHTCDTSKELISYILMMAKDREQRFTISVPNTLPESDMDGAELLRHAFTHDNGFIRWGYKNAGVAKKTDSEYTTFTFKMGYRTTKEQDEEARRLAIKTVEEWNVGNLSDLEKMYRLQKHISANWRYDTTLENMTAYTTLTSSEGTCLGLVMACQILLSEMGIASQTVHGWLVDTDILHIQLLVKLGDWWYTFDPTELAKDKPTFSAYIKNNYAEWIIPTGEYLTESFRSAHPMNPGVLSNNPSGKAPSPVSDKLEYSLQV